MATALIETGSPLEQLRNWKPDPSLKIWIVFEEIQSEHDLPINTRPFGAFHSQQDAIDFCIDLCVDDGINPMDYEIAQEHWDDRYAIRWTTLYPPFRR